MENTIVVKFGGSSLASAGQIKKAASIIRENPARRFVVCSAPGKRSGDDVKVTDLLYQCYDAAADGGDFAPLLDRIAVRFGDIVRELGVSFDLDGELEILRNHLATAPDRDYMASRGEYLNSRIIAAYLGYPFVDPAETIFFTRDGALDGAKTFRVLGERLSGLDRAVIPGFYGVLPDGAVHTFSRGGSDVTGSIAARAAGAAIYENWTDVSGMLTADPRIVDNPRVIDWITYTELRELSYMGASVLHEDAIFPVREAGIPINIRNTNRPEDPGTMIVAVLPGNARRRVVTGVAGRKGFTSVAVEKSMMNGQVGFGARLLQIYAENGVGFEHCPSGIDTMSVIANTDQFAHARDAILVAVQRDLEPDAMSVHDGMAMIAVVGQGMANTRGTAAKVFKALADADINIRMIDQGSSEMNIIVGVDDDDCDDAIRAIYREMEDLM